MPVLATLLRNIYYYNCCCQVVLCTLAFSLTIYILPFFVSCEPHPVPLYLTSCSCSHVFVVMGAPFTRPMGAPPPTTTVESALRLRLSRLKLLSICFLY